MTVAAAFYLGLLGVAVLTRNLRESAGEILPRYGHLDVFIGKNSARDVFPLLISELDKH